MRDASAMRLVAAACICVLLVGCDQRKPAIANEEVQKLKAAMPGMTDECVDKMRWGGIEAMPSELDKCFKMEPPRRWSGLWENGFESSRFCPAPAADCTGRSAGEYIWLSASPSVHLP
jgi:hypothetical protein